MGGVSVYVRVNFENEGKLRERSEESQSATLTFLHVAISRLLFYVFFLFFLETTLWFGGFFRFFFPDYICQVGRLVL